MKRQAEEVELQEQRPLKKTRSPWQQYLKNFAKDQGTQVIQSASLQVACAYMYPFNTAGDHETATVVTQKASAAYKDLTASSKEALKLQAEGTAERKRMTRADMKKRADRIGERIQQLVCACKVRNRM